MRGAHPRLLTLESNKRSSGTLPNADKNALYIGPRVRQLNKRVIVSTDQRKFFLSSPTFNLTLQIKSFIYSFCFMRKNQFYRTSDRGIAVDLPSLMLRDSSFEVRCRACVESTVSAFKDVDPGHDFLSRVAAAHPSSASGWRDNRGCRSGCRLAPALCCFSMRNPLPAIHFLTHRTNVLLWRVTGLRA